MTWFALVTVGLICLRSLTQVWLNRVNLRHVQAHAHAVPDAFKGTIDAPTYSKSVQYTLAKSRLNSVEIFYDTGLLLALLFSGVLPWSYHAFTSSFGEASWSLGAWLWLIAAALSLSGLPIEWYAQFHLEERFGFNTTSPKTWWLDRVKALLLSLLIGYPLLVLLVKIIQWTGAAWWLWAWAALLVFQCLMLVLAPVLIMPLFNKFMPLPEGTLRSRLVALAERTGFTARNIQVMDGSKRSRHSNAFFTGFGRFRKIVLFDTLIQQLTETELEAVLAHEIGHYKKKHIARFLVLSALLSLTAFYVLSLLIQQTWFFTAFGFEFGTLAAGLLLFAFLSGIVTFWLSPLMNLWSRRFEYQADAFAASAMNEPHSLIAALRKLNEKNLSNLTPHPFYSGFYYSHPTLVEREGALVAGSPS